MAMSQRKESDTTTMKLLEAELKVIPRQPSIHHL